MELHHQVLDSISGPCAVTIMRRPTRKVLKDGVIAETIDLKFGECHITVVNQITPTHMKATKESLSWFMSELYKDATNFQVGVTAGGSKSTVGMREPTEVVVAPDSDEEDEEIADLLSEIEQSKKEDIVV